MSKFKKKDLNDFLISEIDLLEPKNFYYKYYYYNLLKLKEENREKSLKELFNNFIKFCKLYYDKFNININNFINIYIKKPIFKVDDVVEEEKVIDSNELEKDDELEYEVKKLENEHHKLENEDNILEDEDDILEDEDDIIEDELEMSKFRELFIMLLKETDTYIIELFMDNEKFTTTKEIIEKSLKRHIIINK